MPNAGTKTLVDEQGRVCTTCNEYQPWEEFYRTTAKGSYNGRLARCRTCDKAKRMAWKRANPERHAAYVAGFQARGGQAAAMRRYRTNHRERVLHRLAVSKGKRAGRYSQSDWVATVRRFGGKCAYCRKAPWEEREHVVPISRGGSNTIGNMLPACRKCNRSKGDLTLMEWRLSGRGPEAIQPISRREHNG